MVGIKLICGRLDRRPVGTSGDKGTLRSCVQTLLSHLGDATMATLRRQYVVTRQVYSEDSFAEGHQKVSRVRKTILDHVKEYLR